MSTETTIKVDPQAIAARLAEEDRAMTLEAQKRFPCHSNRATSLAHECDAFVYFQRTAWDQFTLPEPELEDRFRIGKEREPAVLLRVEAVAKRIGAEIVRTKDQFQDKKHQITGDVDALLRMLEPNEFGLPRRTALVLEVKTVSPYLWEYVQSIDAMKRNQWTAKYLAQETLYLFLSGIEHGLFAFENLNGRRHYLGYSLDFGYAESLIQKADRINAAIEKGQAPARLSRVDTCRDCPALQICCPSLKYGTGEGVQFADEPELIEALNRREILKAQVDGPAVKELDKTDKAVKAALKAQAEKEQVPTLIVGEFIVNIKKQANGTRVDIERLQK